MNNKFNIGDIFIYNKNRQMLTIEAVTWGDIGTIYTLSIRGAGRLVVAESTLIEEFTQYEVRL